MKCARKMQGINVENVLWLALWGALAQLFELYLLTFPVSQILSSQREVGCETWWFACQQTAPSLREVMTELCEDTEQKGWCWGTESWVHRAQVHDRTWSWLWNKHMARPGLSHFKMNPQESKKCLTRDITDLCQRYLHFQMCKSSSSSKFTIKF